MSRYRKKPVEVEAYQWNHRVENFDSAPAWLKQANALDPDEPGAFFVPMGAKDAVVVTLNGHVRVPSDDWIIRGVAGELYPCRNDIFEATYELA